MENNKQSDKNIKGMFENYQPEIDTNAVWENIEPKLKKKKNRRFILFFLLFGAGMLAWFCLLYTSPSPRDRQKSRMPSSA